MRESSFKKSFFILFKLSIESPSNRKTNFGVVLDALNKPQPSSKLILKPSIVIFSPSNEHCEEKSSIILNFVSSVTLMFNSGVETVSYTHLTLPTKA